MICECELCTPKPKVSCYESGCSIDFSGELYHAKDCNMCRQKPKEPQAFKCIKCSTGIGPDGFCSCPLPAEVEGAIADLCMYSPSMFADRVWLKSKLRIIVNLARKAR